MVEECRGGRAPFVGIGIDGRAAEEETERLTAGSLFEAMKGERQ